MAKIFEFQKNDSKIECICPSCELQNDYFDLILNSASEDEMYYYLGELIQESKQIGFKDAIEMDIRLKLNVLKEMDGECDCNGECNGNCEFD